MYKLSQTESVQCKIKVQNNVVFNITRLCPNVPYAWGPLGQFLRLKNAASQDDEHIRLRHCVSNLLQFCFLSNIFNQMSKMSQTGVSLSGLAQSGSQKTGYDKTIKRDRSIVISVLYLFFSSWVV